MSKRSYKEENENSGMVTALQMLLGYELKTSYDVIDIARIARLFGLEKQLLTRLEAMWEHVLPAPIGEKDYHEVEKIRLRRFLQRERGE